MTVSAKAAEDILCVEGECLSADAVDGLCAPRRPVRLVDCDLDGLDLSRRDLTGWTFERCSMRNGRFDGAMLERTVWKSCRAPIASFVGVDLSDAQFLSSDFNNSIFRRAKLTSLTVLSCKLTGADLSEAATMGLGLSETLLIDAKLPDVSFRKQRLVKLDLSRADLRGCDFRMGPPSQLGETSTWKSPMCHGVIAAFLLARSPSWKSLRRPTPW